ncbi:MAG: hypothetical protein RIS64_4155 [Bacteroidota bacterium]|jgi:hypothetical protein
MNIAQARRLIDPPLYTENIVYNYVVISKIIEIIHLADEEESVHPTIKALGMALKGRNEVETCQKIWYFVRNEIRYIADKLGYERVRKANRTVGDGEADCKSFTILTNSLLRVNGISSLYRYVGYDNEDYTHVYPIAILGNGTYLPLDAVPGAIYGKEVGNITKKKDIMSKGVAILRGGPGEIPEPAFLNYSRMTDGELDLHLRRQYALLILGAHPDHPNTKGLKRGIEMLEDAIFKGIHGLSSNTSYFRGLTDGTMYFAKVINQARQRTAPAGNLIELYDRKGISGGTDPLIQLSDAPLECQKYYPGTASGGHWDHGAGRWVNTGVATGDYKTYNECVSRIQKENEMKTMVNEHLEKGCPKWLYLFEPDSTMNKDAVKFQTKVKITDHQRIFGELVSHTGLSASNMRLWTTLGIGRTTSAKGIGIVTPENAIQLLKENPTHTGATKADADRDPRVNEPITLLIICVMILVSAASVAGIIQVCKGKEPTAFGYAEKAISAAWDAQGTDWGGSGKDDDEDEDNPPIPDDAEVARRKAEAERLKEEADKRKKLTNQIVIGAAATAVVGAGAYFLSK